MHVSEFHVVLVDDEPDVHEVSRLAMRGFRVYGLPIRLHSAYSKAEGIALLESLTLGRRCVCLASVALIDVVMETDHAGLELCQHIREVMENRTLQLYLRTGQPGMAPEREVLDRYDIQGYLAKAETTADKLYTVVKAGIRESYFTALSHTMQDLIDYLIPVSRAKEQILQRMKQWQQLARQSRTGEKADTISAPLAYMVGDELLVGMEDWADAGVALKRRDELMALPALPLHENGDCYTIDGRDMLVRIAPSDTNAELVYISRGNAPPPDWEVFIYHRYLRTFSALWKQAG